MKKNVFILMINFACLHFSFGQCEIKMDDIYTPMGKPVETWLMTCETDRLFWDNYYDVDATIIPTYDGYSSTIKFNCHGYAWLRVEQGIDRWIGLYSNTAVDSYISDGSYVRVSSETFPGKVFWIDGVIKKHSAITTEESGTFISKWESGPLYRHRWDDSPYGSDPTKLAYFVRNCPISGSIIISLTSPITTHQTVTACSINIQNVTVSNNAKLTLDAENELTIIKDFELQLGSELEIK